MTEKETLEKELTSMNEEKNRFLEEIRLLQMQLFKERVIMSAILASVYLCACVECDYGMHFCM